MSKKIFLKSVSISYLRQIVALIIGISSVPLMLNYFGTSLFGIWALILGLVGYINNISFGIPSAMSTLVAKASSLRQKYEILKKSLFLLSSIVILFLGIFVGVVFLSDDWIITLLGNVHEEYIVLTKQVFILFIIITFLKIPLNLYMQFFNGMNLVYLSELYQLANLILGFIVLIMSIYFTYDFYLFAILTLGSQITISIFSMIHVLIKFRYLKLHKNDENIVKNSTILRSAMAFFQVGLAASIVWNSDNLVISHFLSVDDVTAYTIAFKMFTYIFMFSAIINGVLSPIYGNAYAEKDFRKMKLYGSLVLKLLPILGGIVWFSLLFFSKDIIIVWTGSEESFGGYLLIFSLGLYAFILSYVNTYSTLLFSMNYANKTLWIVWSEALLNLLLSILFIQYFGIGGVALATALASLFTAFIFLPKIINKLTKNQISFEYSFLIKHFIVLVVPVVSISVWSISIENLIVKIIVYIGVLFLYLLLTYKMLSGEDKAVTLNLLRKRGV